MLKITCAEVEVIEEPLMTAETDAAIRKLLCESFPLDVAVFSRTRYWHGQGPAYSLVCREQGRVLGHVGVVMREIAVDARRLLVAGIQNLAVSPLLRGKGVGGRLMNLAMDQAIDRGISFGLLFCVPELESFYRDLGWQTITAQVTVVDENGCEGPIPEKNITMIKALACDPFPTGSIHLRGSDW